MQLSRYIILYPPSHQHTNWLIYSTLRGTILQGTDELVEALHTGQLEPEELEQLTRLGVLVTDAEAERERLLGFFAEADQRATRYNYLVTLNLDCNLACGYCYEDHFRGSRYMSDQTADLLLASAINGPLAAGKQVTMDFYGGEPLLSLPLIRRIATSMQQASAQRNQIFSFTLTTNGTLLTPDLVAELKPLGLVGAKLTLDGPPDIHDLQRPFVSGKGSFECIVKNLKCTCEQISIQIGGNFTRRNFHSFPRMLDLLTEQGITPDKLRMVYFNPVTPKAGEAGVGDFSNACACTSEPWLVDASLFLRHEIIKRGFNTTKPRFNACMVEFDSDLVVNYDGALYKCPAFMGWEDMRIGSLSDGISDYSGSHRIGQWNTPECLDCVYLPHCFGGCRFLQRLRTGSIEGVDCRKSFIEATLEQLILQDLGLKNIPQIRY